MTTVQYEGYLADLEIDPDAGVIHGEVVNTSAVLTFESETVEGAVAAFRETIVDYLAWCKERDEKPERPYSGVLSLRVGPELHRDIAMAARHAGVSINLFITGALEAAVHGGAGVIAAQGFAVPEPVWTSSRLHTIGMADLQPQPLVGPSLAFRPVCQ